MFKHYIDIIDIIVIRVLASLQIGLLACLLACLLVEPSLEYYDLLIVPIVGCLLLRYIITCGCFLLVHWLPIP